MNLICEMQLTDYFKLSTGHVALVGRLDEGYNEPLNKCQAYLYIGDKKVRSIHIVGEDQFSRVDESMRQGRRSVRTTDDVYQDLKSAKGEKIKLVFYNG